MIYEVVVYYTTAEKNSLCSAIIIRLSLFYVEVTFSISVPMCGKFVVVAAAKYSVCIKSVASNCEQIMFISFEP